jgi:osmotically-inducible protein OsmY
MKGLTAIALGALLALPLAAEAETPGVHGKPADNSEKNVRDRDGGTLVPTDQTKGSDADVEMTRNIRKAIVGDEGLSTNAHNVKIVTLGGIATLRGPVASAAEKTRVGDLAAKAAGGPTKIKNELEHYERPGVNAGPHHDRHEC